MIFPDFVTFIFCDKNLKLLLTRENFYVKLKYAVIQEILNDNGGEFDSEHVKSTLGEPLLNHQGRAIVFRLAEP
jgi:hypothetical protein